MPSLLFFLFAAITLLFGVLVVVSKNPVTSALALAVSFVGLAALFIGLDAYFIGTIQVLVYAGAVMVLFLFIIMLLAVLVLQIATVLRGFDAGKKTRDDAPLNARQAAAAMGATALPTIVNDLKDGTLPDTKLMGLQLYHRYAFHLQIVGLLLLVSTIGVVVLSKRERQSGGPPS